MAPHRGCRCRSNNNNMPRILLLLLVTVVLLSSSVCVAQEDNFTQYEQVNLKKCFDALRDADVDGNGKIDADEHVLFLQTFGPSEYWNDIEQRPLELKAKFNAVACMCIQRGSGANCCHGDSATIDIQGILEDNRQEGDYLETVCILTQRAIDEVERQRVERNPGNSESSSVWLRTSYQVALLQGNTQSQEEVLQDLGTVMDLLVDGVLQQETSQRKRIQGRKLQDVEYLPTRLEWNEDDCKVKIPPQNVCYQVDTTTYVVGPQDQLDQAALETALINAIASGRLQALLDTFNPDSYLRIVDEVPEETEKPVSTEAPAPPPSPEGEEEEAPIDDTGHDWSVGAITGLVLAAVGTIGLAAGLSYKRRQTNKKQKELREQRLASRQGSKINMELRDDSLEHDLDDLEKGNGGGGILLADTTGDSSHRVSYKMNQVGMQPYENDSVPAPPPTDPSFVILPFVGKRPQSSKEPSAGDLGASYNIHMDSLDSSTAFALTDRKASSGSIGARTPVTYSSAMGLGGASHDDDSSYASSSSSSSSSSDSDFTEGDTDSQDSSSSSGSSEYGQYGIMKERAYEARLAEARGSMTARTLEENVVAQDAPVEPSTTGIVAATTIGAAALGGTAFYVTTQDADDNDEPVVEDTTSAEMHTGDATPPPPLQTQSDTSERPESIVVMGQHEDPGLFDGDAVAGRNYGDSDDPVNDPNREVTSNQGTLPPPPSSQVSSNTVDVPENNAALSTAPAESPNTGLIAGVTAGAAGILALGGVAVYAATRGTDDDDDSVEENITSDSRDLEAGDLETPPPQTQTESEVPVSAAVAPVGVAVAGVASVASIHDPVAVGEESLFQLGSDGHSVDTSRSENTSTGLAPVGGLFTEGGESQTIDDPVAVGEESFLIENESSVSVYSPSDVYATGFPSLGTVHETVMTEGGDSTLESSIESGSSGSSLAQVEDLTTLRPPPRPPSPTDNGASLATATAVGTGAAGVGVTAAFLSTRRQTESSSETESDSSSEASSDDYSEDSGEGSSDDSSASSTDDSSESSSEDSRESDDDTNTDSQVAAAIVHASAGNDVPMAGERARPPPNGSDNPYYTAAAAMSTGAVVTGAVYDFSESGYSTSSFDRSTEGGESLSVFEASFDREENAEKETPSAAVLANVEEKVSLDGDGDSATQRPAETAKVSSVRRLIQNLEKRLSASSAGENRTGTSTGPAIDNGNRGENAAAAAVVGVGAIAFTAAAQTDGGSSSGAEASSAVGSDKNGSESDSDSEVSVDSSTDVITDVATTGRTLESRSIADETHSLSTNVGLLPSSNRSVGSDAAVVQGHSLATDPMEASVDGSSVSEAAVVVSGPTGASDSNERSSALEEVNVAPDPIPAAESTELSTPAVLTAPNLPVDGAEGLPTEAAVVEDQTSIVASSHATKPSTQEGGGASTGAVVTGVVAGGAALAGVAAYALGRRSPTGDDLESSTDVDGITDDSRKETLPSYLSLAAVGDESLPTEATVVDQEQNSTIESTQLSSEEAASSGPMTRESDDVATSGAVITGAVSGGIVAAGAATYAPNDSKLSEDEAQDSTDGERTTNEESSADESADVVTDVAISGARSLSRSTLGSTIATRYAGTQSVSRSTLETSGSSLQGSYQGQEGSAGQFFGKDSDSSLAKVGMESQNVALAASVSAANEFDESSSSGSSSGSSSSYDSDSSDEYYSSGSEESSGSDISDAEDTKERSTAPSTETSGVVSEATVMAGVALAASNGTTTDDADATVLQESSELNAAEMSESGTATFTESATATLTESGHTFLAMEEAAFVTSPHDVAVAKTRFAPTDDVQIPEEAKEDIKAISTGAAAGAVGVGMLGIGAVAAATTQTEEDEDSQSASSEYTDTSSGSSSSDSSSYDSSTIGSDSSTEYSSDSSDDDESTAASEKDEAVPEAIAKSVNMLDGSDDKTTESELPLKEESADKPDFRSQLRPVKSEGLISQRRETGVAPGGVGSTRAQLLRARSDAMLPGSKRDESLQSLLTSWDQDYDLTTGEEETTTSSEESLLVLYANAALPPIEEVQSDESSQTLSLSESVPLSEDAIAAALRSGPLPEDAIAAATQHGSSSLLNFDYSLRTVAEEQSGDMSFEGSAGTISSSERAAALDQTFENEVLKGLDTISEVSESPDKTASRGNLSQVASPTEEQETRVQDVSSGRMTLESSGTYSRSTMEEDSDESSVVSSSSYSTASSSEYTTDSSASSKDSGSTTTSSSGDESEDSTSYQSVSTDASSTGGSSTTSGSPAPSSPDTSKVLTDASSFSPKLPSLGEQDELKPSSVAERDALAESAAWAAIAEANKPNTSEGEGDAAEWAIKRSLSALRMAERRASTLASSSESPSSSSDEVSFSSDYTSNSSSGSSSSSSSSGSSGSSGSSSSSSSDDESH